ncbi:MAG: 2-C-methyl-D-erythritol 2,4-cyclodiphosphate synthase [Porphyromonadaceae bacterium]|jgi:2-C-methyl-D-erythritol 2,4-cyclodiphosphate synthase|nr:2-C-methyl-D-erythritol 2,4-cyclodiphosphate synthase [Porphyromonadaceae bacterium]MDD6314238.1 2-C-methyl-D-erythritol 2,4-cyclodiphosphate synthase [Porphyromonadaceae bacterium]
MRIHTGLGYDVHRLVEGRELWLCGVRLEHTRGLLGHSDADVAIHALCDALLGAAALGDIGHLFPDNDPQYKGIDSKILLREVVRRIGSEGWTVQNVDVTITAQAPKIAPHIPQMRETLAAILGIPTADVSVKATTTERLGFEGRKEGISALATALLTQ